MPESRPDRMQWPRGLSYPMRLYSGVRKPSRITILGQGPAGRTFSDLHDHAAYLHGGGCARIIAVLAAVPM